jgi:hypothetical protein
LLFLLFLHLFLLFLFQAKSFKRLHFNLTTLSNIFLMSYSYSWIDLNETIFSSIFKCQENFFSQFVRMKLTQTDKKLYTLEYKIIILSDKVYKVFLFGKYKSRHSLFLNSLCIILNYFNILSLNISWT